MTCVSLSVSILSGVSVRHPRDKDFDELVKAGLLAQQGSELFDRAKLRAEGER